MILKYIFLIFIFFTYSLKACEKPTMPTASEWNNWLEDVRNEAKDKNISEKTKENIKKIILKNHAKRTK